MKNKYILHDLPDSMAEAAFRGLPEQEWTIISANKPAARCIGCFRCWLKKPGFCTFADGNELLGKNIITAQQLILVSESLYGGYSINIKRLWDRMIPGVLPFFETIHNELHHQRRYHTATRIKAVFYNGNEMTEAEKQQARELVAANGLNFHALVSEAVFVNGAAEIERCLP